MTALDLIALLGLGIGAVTFLAYPLAVVCIAALARPRTTPTLGDERCPSVSVLIAAHAEAAVIEQKLRSVADSDYPGRVECLLGDDGSPDGTLTAARRATWPGLRLLALPRRGKSAVLARLVAEATGEILVFTDADPLFRRDTLRELVRPFGDPGIGAVAGVVDVAGGGGDGLFRRYENAIRRAEDRLFGAISADGGLYAVRRDLYRQPPEGVTDDFYVSTEAVARGLRIAFAPGARVTEQPVERPRALFRRRVRITVRGLASVATRRDLLSVRRHGGYAIGLFFHKVMRRLAPPAICLGLATGAISLSWRAVLTVGPAVLIAPLLVVVALAALVQMRRPPRPVRLAVYVLTGLAAMSWGLVLFAVGHRRATWTPARIGMGTEESS